MGFFRNAYKNIASARQRQADEIVAHALYLQDDETLKAMGKSRSELRRGASRYML